MKLPIIIILLCLLCNASQAQNFGKARKFINEVVTDKNINYQDSVDKSVRDFMHRFLKDTRVIYHFREDSVDYQDSAVRTKAVKDSKSWKLFKDDGLPNVRITDIITDSLVLTDAELIYANHEIDKMRYFKWKRKLFPNSKLLLADSLSALQKRWDEARNKSLTGLSKQEREVYLTALIKKASKEFVAFHKLSIPIFLRNDSYCLFYYGDDCINTTNDWGCGAGSFMAYKKVKGKWMFWGFVGRWLT